MPFVILLRKVLCVSALLVFFITECYSQSPNFDNYSPLVSSGDLPEELTTTSTEKYKESKKSISRKDRRSIKKLKKQFYLKSSFSIDELLRSGKVLYNDPVGNYVNKVFDIVKKSADLEEENLKLFVIKTNYSNAFATDQGYIFITTGLLSRLENEAQLAFILCHELIHFTKKHSIDIFINNNSTSKKLDYVQDFKFLSSATYSREKEQEADADGLDIFIKTDYNKAAAYSVFNVLHYSHLPFENTLFKKDFFGSGDILWSNSFFMQEVDSIYLPEDEDDKYSTHPNTYERKTEIEKSLGANIKSVDAKNFLLPKNEFFTARKICRYEFCRLALIDADYCNAIYASYVLQKENPTSIYLQKIMAKALFGVSTYYNAGKRLKLKIKTKGKQGELQQVYAFFKNSYAYEANTLTVKYLWSLKKKYPLDDEINTLFSRSITDLTYLHFQDINEFKSGVLPDSLKKDNDLSVFAGISEDVYNDSVRIAKLVIAKLVKDSLIDKGEVGASFSELKAIDIKNRQQRILYAFSSELSDQNFKSEFNTAKEKNSAFREEIIKKSAKLSNIKYIRKKKGERNPLYKVLYDSLRGRKKEEMRNNLRLSKKKYLGRFSTKLKDKEGKKVIFYNPLYYTIDLRKTTPVKYVASEKTRETFINRLKISAKEANLPFEVITDNELGTTDAEKINNISLISDWINEYYFHKGKIDLPATDVERIDELRNSLNSDYLCLAGNVYTINDKDYVGLAIFASIMPLYWPFTLPYLLTKDVDTRYFLITLDLKERRIIYDDYRELLSKNRSDISLALFYDMFSQLKIYQEQ